MLNKEETQGVILDRVEMLQAPIAKANDIIRQSQFSLSLVESRIVAYMLANTNQKLGQFNYIQFRTRDFCNACGISKTNPQYVKNVIKRLYNKSIVVRIKRSDEHQNIISDSYVPIKILDDFEVAGKDGYVALKFHDRLAPYFLELKKNFTLYYFGYSVFFKSKYSLPLYELLKSYANMSLTAKQHVFSYRISIEEFRSMMGLGTKLEHHSDLKRRILDVCVGEINQYTDIKVEMEEERYGKAVRFLLFRISMKETKERLEILNRAQEKMCMARKDVRIHSSKDDPGIIQEIEVGNGAKPFLPMDGMRADVLDKVVETVTYFTTEDDETGQISLSF